MVRPAAIIGVFGGPDGFKRTYRNGDRVEFVDIVFRCSLVRASKSCAQDEISDVQFVPRSEISKLPWMYPLPLVGLLRIRNRVHFR